jgi:L-lactate dehydrogenase complex protein LldG
VSEARHNILQRLRAHADRQPEGTPALDKVRPAWDRTQRLERFRRQFEAVRGEVHTVGPHWPRRLLELMQNRGLHNLLYGPGTAHGAELTEAWSGDSTVDLIPYEMPVEDWRDRLFSDIDAAFTGCRGAIAETGSLVLWPTPEEPRLMSLVPPVHFVLLDSERIYASFAELVDQQRWSQGMPSNALLISGPSKSADIEQTLAYGVHGPRALIVLVRQAT